MSVFHAANRGPLRRPIATFTALTVAGFGFIAAPAFGAEEVEPLQETTVTAPADPAAEQTPTGVPEDDNDVTSTPSEDEPTPEADLDDPADADESGSEEATAAAGQALEGEVPEDEEDEVVLPEADTNAARSMVPFALADEIDIDILSINDLHGRIEADRASAGGAVLACTVRTMKADNPNTIFVSAGDNVGASTFTSFVADDQPTLDVLNAIPLDVSSLGNHEFDQGQDDLDGRIIPEANFPYIAANVYTKAGVRAYDPYDIVERDGVKVGFIGGVTEELSSLVTPAGIANLETRDLADEVNAVARQLTDGDLTNGEADIVIAVVHDGSSSSDMASTNGTPYGKLLTDADDSIVAVISGHTHQAYVAKVGDVWATQTGQYGENLGQLTLTYDKATGEVVDSEAKNLPLVTEPGCPPAADVQQIVDAATTEADVLGAEPIGNITADLNRAEQSDESENRGGESTLGNAVADVQLWAAQRTAPGAQIAFMNPGGLRKNLAYEQAAGEGDGVVTYKEAAVVQPFANTLVTTDLTGAQIIQVLEEQWQPDSSSRPFLKLGVSEGLFYVYDPNAARGERILEVWLNGELLDPDAFYTVVANSFLASGGDNFTTLAQGGATRDTGQSDLGAMVDYFAEVGEISPDYQQRAVGLSWVSDPDQVYAPGEEIAIDASSLLFSTTEPKPTELTTILGGIATGSAEVDASVVDTFDEVGRAQVRVIVPADIGQDLDLAASADVEVDLVIVDEVTGLELSVPVMVAVEVLVDDEDQVTPPGDETPGDETPAPTDDVMPPGGPTSGGTTPGGGQLPKTGSNAGALVLMALLFVGVGTGLAVKRRQILQS